MSKRRFSSSDRVVPFRCFRCNRPLPVVLQSNQPLSPRNNPFHSCPCGLVWELFLLPPRPTSRPEHTFFRSRSSSVPVSCFPLIHSPATYAFMGIPVYPSDWLQSLLIF